MYIHSFVAIMSTFRTKARLAGAMDTLVGNAMICKHLVIPHWDGWRIDQNINLYTKMKRNTINKSSRKLSIHKTIQSKFEIIYIIHATEMRL